MVVEVEEMDDDARVGVMMVKSTATFRHAEKNTGCFKQGKAQRAAIQSNTGLLDQKFGFLYIFLPVFGVISTGGTILFMISTNVRCS